VTSTGAHQCIFTLPNETAFASFGWNFLITVGIELVSDMMLGAVTTATTNMKDNLRNQRDLFAGLLFRLGCPSADSAGSNTTFTIFKPHASCHDQDREPSRSNVIIDTNAFQGQP